MGRNMHDTYISRKTKNARQGVPTFGLACDAIRMERMRKLRKARKMTQTRLAEMVELDQAQISRIERGSETTLSTIYRIAEALEVSPAELFAPPAHLARLDAALQRIPPERRERALLILEALADS